MEPALFAEKKGWVRVRRPTGGHMPVTHSRSMGSHISVCSDGPVLSTVLNVTPGGVVWWRARLLWTGQGLAQETLALPPPHQRVSHLYLSSGTEPHTLGHTLLAAARGSQLWVASSRGSSCPRQVWTWAWTWHPLLPAQLCFFPPPCEPWGPCVPSQQPQRIQSHCKALGQGC